MEGMNNMINGLGEILDNLTKNLINTGNGDYINEKDGLIYCGLCNTPKQQVSNICGEMRKTPKVCECEKKEIEKRREENRLLEHQRHVSYLRGRAFSDPLLSQQTFANEDGSLEHKKLGLNYVDQFAEMEQENIGLLLTGSVGTGKTYLASSIANALIEKGISVKMTNFSVILNDMMNLEINKNKYIESLNKNRLLIIDDFGMERNTAFATEHIFNIIDSRYRANKPIILTTNLSISEMTAASGIKEQRVYSRIMEMATPVLFTGENKRIGKMKEKAKRAHKLLMESR